MANLSHQRRPRPRIRLPLWGLGLLILVVVGIVSATAVWIFNTAQTAASAWEATSPDFVPAGDAPLNNDPTTQDSIVTTLVTPTPAFTEDTSNLISSEALQPWQGVERINVLLLGIDLRCDEEGPTHTDTMMVVTIDPVGQTAAALSLPRDLWVSIPNFDLNRINQAYFLGELNQYPGGGAALAVETVEGILGIPIHYYSAVNFDAFIEFVDLIGGIDIEVPEAIDDPNYPDRCYGFEPFQIQAGTHHLDGALALKYARTRATFGGDIDRAGRQQQVMLAVRDSILDVDMVPRLIVQAPQLWQSFQNNVRTNMTLDEVIQLGLLAQNIPAENIQLAVLDHSYVYEQITPDGRQVLVPRRDEIRRLRDALFAPAAIPTPAIENLQEVVRQENARVAIYNGTATFGLASDTQAYLLEQGVNVVEVGNADSATYASSQIIDFSDSQATSIFLAQLLDVPPLNISYGTLPTGDYDILVIIGNDWLVPLEE